MTDTNDGTAPTALIVLGDYETADCLAELADTASNHGTTIAEIHAYPPGTAHDAEDLTDVDGAVGALAAAITHRANVWVPYPLQDMPREAHWRRLSLALQRHGLNLVVGP